MKRSRIILLTLTACLIVMQAAICVYAVSDQAVKSSGTAPTSKTDQTIRAENELKKLKEEEKKLKESIKNETINRAKLLAQKRADLKSIRQKRDEPIKKDVDAIKGRKDKQAALLKELKKQLSALKKAKSHVAVSALEVTITLAQIKLDDIKKEYKSAKDKLSKSYQDYKQVYEKMTVLDKSLKTILNQIEPLQKKIITFKAEMKTVKSDYTSSNKNKDFTAAQHKMERMVQLQKSINTNHSLILDCRKHFKSEYTLKVVNYKLS